MSDTLDLIKGMGDQKISRTLDLGDHDEMYRGAIFEVWVAPTGEHLQEWQELTNRIAVELPKLAKTMTEEEQKEALAEWQSRQAAWYGKTWLNIPPEEVPQIRDALPGVVWDWLLLQTSRMIRNYRQEKLKNSNGG